MAEEINGQTVNIENIAGIATGAASDGWDVTQGSKADAPVTAATINATPTTVASVVALLKGILTGQSSGGGGAVTIASGSDATEGALGDAPLAAAASTSNSTVNAALKGLFNLLYNGTAGVVLKAGSAIVGKFGIDQTTPGTTNGVVVNSSSLPTGAATASGQAAQQGPVAPGTAAANSVLIGLVYNSTAPAPTTGQQLALQSDSAGNLKVNNATLAPGAAADGSDPASPAVANQGAGIRGWLATIAALLRLGTAASAASASVVMATDMPNLEPGGTAITASSGMPAGGKGLTGWLSTIAYQLAQTPNVKNAIWYVEQAYGANNVASGGATTQNNRGGFMSPSTPGNYSYFQAALFATQAGTLTIYNSTGGNPVQVASVTTTANTTTTLKTPAFGSAFSVQWTNTGASASSTQLISGFTAA